MKALLRDEAALLGETLQPEEEEEQSGEESAE